jgi:phosphatidylglycerophosphatase A
VKKADVAEVEADPRQRWLDRLALVLATWFGCGLSPVAPGTAGTLGALPLYLLVAPGGPWAVALAALVVAAVGIAASGRVARRRGLPDPQLVCIDEVAGVLVALTAARLEVGQVAIAVILFRVFDIWKPWPVRQLERHLPGGWGIVGDDLAAGAWAALLLGAGRLLLARI